MYKRMLSLGIILLFAGLTLQSVPSARAEGNGSSISGVVYIDKDLDAVRDPGESPAPGRKLVLTRLFDESPWEALIDTDVSDGHGAYILAGIVPNARYRIDLVTDSDTPCWNRQSFYYPFDSEDTSTDFGVLEKGSGSISGIFTDDRDEDGTLDPGEPGLEGWRVTLYTDLDSGSMDCDFSDLTDYSGRYGFKDLPLLRYRVNYWPETNSSIFEVTSPTEPANSAAAPHSPLVDLRDKEHVQGINILAHYIVGSSVINGIAFRDLNLNGVRDEGEDVLNCVVYGDQIAVYRKTPAGALFVNNAYPTCTDASFTLSGVAAGDYVVQFYNWCVGPNAPAFPSGEAPSRPVAVAEGRHSQPVEINMCPQAQAWFPGPEPTPEPTPTPTVVVTMPGVGTGPDAAMAWSANAAATAIALFAGAGAIGLAFVLRRRSRLVRPS
jgi:SdrD B-like domain